MLSSIYTVRTVGVCGPGPFAVVGIGNIVNSKFNVVYDGNGKTDLLNLNDVINRRFFPPPDYFYQCPRMADLLICYILR